MLLFYTTILIEMARRAEAQRAKVVAANYVVRFREL